MKIIGILLASILSFSCFAFAKAPMYSACPQGEPNTSPAFCASFEKIAFCHCSKRLPEVLCKDMNTLYSRMIMMFGSIQKACEWQKDTTTQNCIDNWNCYRNGGKNSQGSLCSSTGKACQ